MKTTKSKLFQAQETMFQSNLLLKTLCAIEIRLALLLSIV